MTSLHLPRPVPGSRGKTAITHAHQRVLLLVCGLLVSHGAQSQVGNADRGATLYGQRCSACHAVDYNGVGPSHRGVFERLAGQAPDYTYSPALKASHLKWTAANLERWLTDPEKLVPGQKMGVSVPQSQDRADLIAYLKSLSAAAH